MIRILHVADVHLGASYSSFGELAEERGRQVVRAFQELPRVAQENSVQAVVVAGDLFDVPRPEERVAAVARDTVRRLLEVVRAVFLVPGNHDPLVFPGSPYATLPAEAHVFTAAEFGEPVSVETEAGPIHFYGLAYDFAHNPRPLSGFRRSDAEGTHVMLLHGAVRDAPTGPVETPCGWSRPSSRRSRWTTSPWAIITGTGLRSGSLPTAPFPRATVARSRRSITRNRVLGAR